MRKIFLLGFFIFSSILFAQSYSGPESVEWDSTNNRWLISNTTSHAILARSPSGTLTTFVNSTGAGPHGLEILGNVLYACCSDSIKGYDLTTGIKVFSIDLNAAFLNGLTTDGDSVLYATDFSNRDIFRINPSTNKKYTLSSNTVSTPNGIIYDGDNNRCIFINWGSNAPIKAIDLNPPYTISTITATTLGNCDGITGYNCGYYYVTAWSNNKLNRFNPDFSGGFTVMAGTLSSPADIDIKTGVLDTVGIPNAGNNTCSFPSLTPLAPIVATVMQFGDSLATTTTFGTYQWYHDGVLIPGANSQWYIVTSGGDYYCDVTQFGCYATSNTVTSNLSLQNYISTAGKVFPNPANDVIVVEFYLANQQTVNYSIIDMQGRTIKTGNEIMEVQGLNYVTVYLDGIEDGAYILQLNGESVSLNRTFIVSR